MRYKTLTVSSNSKTAFCSAANGEQWSSIDNALNELAEDGWEIDQVIVKTDLKREEAELRLLKQPILILKHTNLSKSEDIHQQIKRQQAKIDLLHSKITYLQEDEKYREEQFLKKLVEVLDEIKANL